MRCVRHSGHQRTTEPSRTDIPTAAATASLLLRNPHLSQTGIQVCFALLLIKRVCPHSRGKHRKVLAAAIRCVPTRATRRETTAARYAPDSYRITSSAWSRSDCGTVSPSALARLEVRRSHAPSFGSAPLVRRCGQFSLAQPCCATRFVLWSIAFRRSRLAALHRGPSGVEDRPVSGSEARSRWTLPISGTVLPRRPCR